VFSVLDISALVGLCLDCESIFHALTTSKAMKISGLAILPQKVHLERLSWGLLQFDFSKVEKIIIWNCRSQVINEWLDTCLSKCGSVLHVHLGLCEKLTDVGVEAIATHCKQLLSVEIQDVSSKTVTDKAVQALSRQCAALKTIVLSGLEHVSDASAIPLHSLADSLSKSIWMTPT